MLSGTSQERRRSYAQPMVGGADRGRRSSLASGVRQFRFSFDQRVDPFDGHFGTGKRLDAPRQRLGDDRYDAQH
jgi:hypothetical protein